MSVESSLLQLQELFLSKLQINNIDSDESSQQNEISFLQSTTSSSKEHPQGEPTGSNSEQLNIQIFNDRYQLLDTNICSSLLSRLDKVNINYVSPNDVSIRFYRYKQNQKRVFQKRMQDLEKIITQKIDIPLELKQININNQKLYRLDLENLKPPKYLNGECIYFYLKMIIENIADQNIRNNTFLYNTYFMTKLLGEYITNQKKLDSIKDVVNKQFVKQIKLNAEKLLRWTKNTNIFQKSILIFPINLPMHWISIMVINLPQLVSSSNGKNSYQNNMSIIYMDSMGRKNKSLIQAIRIYLQLELDSKQMYRQNKIQINKQILPDYQLLLPRQANFHDCGPCTLLNVQCFLLNPQLLNKDFSNIKVRKQFLNLYPKSLIFTMRQRMINLFLRFYQSKDNKQLKQIHMREYMQYRQQLINNQDQNDYDAIDGKQFKKFLAIKRYQVQNSQQQYNRLLQFYLDPQYNYFQNK